MLGLEHCDQLLHSLMFSGALLILVFCHAFMASSKDNEQSPACQPVHDHVEDTGRYSRVDKLVQARLQAPSQVCQN